MDVRDFILSETPTESTNETIKASKPRKKPAGPTWEVVLRDACDAIVRRKTAKTSRLLVLLMSQGQFYIKDEKSNEVEVLNTDNLAAFMRGSAQLDVVPWCTRLGSTQKGAAHFCKVIQNEDFQWLARRGLHKMTYDCGRYNYDDGEYNLRRKHEEADSPLKRLVAQAVVNALGQERANELRNGSDALDASEAKAKVALAGEYNSNLKEFEAHFGLDWTRAYLTDFILAPYTGNRMPSLTSYRVQYLFDTTKFEPGRFIEYILHDSVIQGYGTTAVNGYSGINDFLQEWSDVLRMQKQIRGKVYDKYPDDLPLMHRKLSFKVRLMEHQINEQNFTEHSERLSSLAKSDSHYLIRPPFNKEDMVDEATMQANCLASYIDAYTNNETDIYFMRDVQTPDASLVTVEVRNGAIRQAYRSHNRRPSVEEISWLNKWAKEHSIKPLDADSQTPMNA